MFFRLVRRFSTASLLFHLLLLGASGIFVYQVSPLRDPTFQPESVNAGSRIPWLQGVNDEHWLLGAAILAALLATNLTLVLWQWYSPRTVNITAYWQQLSRQIIQLMVFIYWVGIWGVLFGALWFLFLLYLLQQWLVD